MLHHFISVDMDLNIDIQKWGFCLGVHAWCLVGLSYDNKFIKANQVARYNKILQQNGCKGWLLVVFTLRWWLP